MKSSFNPKGTVNYVVYKDGVEIDRVCIKNLILNTGRGKMALCFAGTPIGNFVSQIGAGSSNTAATVSDVSLTSGAFTAIGTATFPTGTSVKFAFNIGTGVANGITVQELGLASGDGTLLSRVVIPATVKTSAISIVGTWEIDF